MVRSRLDWTTHIVLVVAVGHFRISSVISTCNFSISKCQSNRTPSAEVCDGHCAQTVVHTAGSPKQRACPTCLYLSCRREWQKLGATLAGSFGMQTGSMAPSYLVFVQLPLQKQSLEKTCRNNMNVCHMHAGFVHVSKRVTRNHIWTQRGNTQKENSKHKLPLRWKQLNMATGATQATEHRKEMCTELFFQTRASPNICQCTEGT